MSIKGFPTSGKMFKQDELDYKVDGEKRQKFVTVQPIGSNKHALDAVTKGYYAYAVDAVVEVGSTDVTLIKTAHGAKVGDVVTLKITSNSINEVEVAVAEIIDANTLRLAAVLSASLTAGDTFDLSRPRNWNVDVNGNIVTSQGPVQFVLDGSPVTVNEDTGTPANNRPLPVKLTDITGDINITAGDLNVQLSHIGASYDSIRIGDGINELAFNGSGEALVNDADANVKLTDLLTELQLKADLSETQPVSAASLPLPSGAATEAKQDDAITEATSTNTKLDTIIAKDFATETTLAAINGKMNSLGQKADANSMPVVISSDQQVILETIRNSLVLLDNIVNGSDQAKVAIEDAGTIATEVTLASLEGKDFATETTLANIDANTPGVGQSTMAGSSPVVIASNQTPIDVNPRVNAAGNGISNTGVTGAVAVTLTPTITEPIKVIIQADETNSYNIRVGLGFTPTIALV
jgi:hypothetical protein